MNLTITINMDNDSFTDNNGSEVARILKALADSMDGKILEVENDGGLRDSNGNRTGCWDVMAS